VISSDPQRPLRKHFVDFCGPRFTRLLRRHPLAEHAPCYFAPPTRVRELFAHLQEGGRDAGPHTPEICGCLLELLLLRLASSAITQDDAESAARHTYQRCRLLIESRFLALQTLGDIAEACHADRAYLCRLFKRYGAEPPYQVLVRLKMRHAADQLSGSPALIKQVAKAVGFTDPFHFSRVFKKMYGVSPLVFVRSASRETPFRDAEAAAGKGD
jgi:AraC-like DNA-binding protein